MDKDLIKQVAAATGEKPAMVAAIVDGYEKMIADTIKSGEMKNIRVPLFGLFHVNLKKLAYETQVRPLPKSKIQKPNK